MIRRVVVLNGMGDVWGAQMPTMRYAVDRMLRGVGAPFFRDGMILYGAPALSVPGHTWDGRRWQPEQEAGPAEFEWTREAQIEFDTRKSTVTAPRANRGTQARTKAETSLKRGRMSRFPATFRLLTTLSHYSTQSR